MISYLKCFKKNNLLQKIIYLKRTSNSVIASDTFINYPYRFGGLNISPTNQPRINAIGDFFFPKQVNPIDKIYLQTLEAMSNRKEAKLQNRFSKKLIKQIQQDVFLSNKNSQVDVFYQSLSLLLGYKDDQKFNLQKQQQENIIKLNINKSVQTQQNYNLLIAFDVVFKSRAKLSLQKTQNDKQEYHNLILGKSVKLDSPILLVMMHQLAKSSNIQPQQFILEIISLLQETIVKGGQFKVENIDSFLK